MPRHSNHSVYSLAVTAVMAAALCVLGPITIPAGPVPFSLTNLVICLSVYLLGGRQGSLSVLVYVLLGAMGIPVFSGFSGGFGALFGPTGGYILGYLFLALIAGQAIDRSRNRMAHLLGMVLGTAALYTLGTVWFCLQSGTVFRTALALCVLPFLPGDAVKIGLALLLGPMLRRRLAQAGFHLES